MFGFKIRIAVRSQNKNHITILVSYNMIYYFQYQANKILGHYSEWIAKGYCTYNLGQREFKEDSQGLTNDAKYTLWSTDYDDPLYSNSLYSQIKINDKRPPQIFKFIQYALSSR